MHGPNSSRSVILSLFRAALLACIPLAVSCTVHVDPTLLPEPPLKDGCNPLGGGPGEGCLRPFLSNYYLRTTASGGQRVSFPIGVMPASRKGVALDPALLSDRDGFSPATRIIAYFPTPLDGSSLPTPARIEDSRKLTSPVPLTHLDSGQRIPLFAELDRSAGEGERQALLIHPEVRLLPKSRYVVAISGLKSSDGSEVAPLSGFAAIRNGDVQLGNIRSSVAAQYEALLKLPEAQGLPKRGIMGKVGSKNPEVDKLILGICQKSYEDGFYLLPESEPPAIIIPVGGLKKEYVDVCIDMFSGAFDNCAPKSIDTVGATPLPPQCFGPEHLAITGTSARQLSIRPGITDTTTQKKPFVKMGGNITPALYVPIKGARTPEELRQSLRYVSGMEGITLLQYIRRHSKDLDLGHDAQTADFTLNQAAAGEAVLRAIIYTTVKEEEKYSIMLKIKGLSPHIDLEFFLHLFSLGDPPFARGYIQSILQDPNSLKNLGFEEAIARKKNGGSYFKNLNTQIAFEKLAAVLEKMGFKESYIQKFPASAPVFAKLDPERVNFLKRLIIGAESFRIVYRED